MLNAVLATIASILWIGSYGLFFLPDLREWWQVRRYNDAMSEIERLHAVRAYAAWVRNMPPAPVRPRVGATVVPSRVVPPVGVGGSVVPFPGRRMMGN